TALQLDTKIDGLPAEVLAEALQQAHEARQTILGVMAGAIAQPRASVNEHAPKIVSIEIPLDKIGEVIGPKGKVINAIQQETGDDPSGRRRRDDSSGGRGRPGDRGAPADRPASGVATAENRSSYVSFDEDAFERELESELGQLGPEATSTGGSGPRRSEGGRG